MEYILITTADQQAFLLGVNEAIKDGFKPIGGVAITHKFWFAQALVREDLHPDDD